MGRGRSRQAFRRRQPFEGDPSLGPAPCFAKTAGQLLTGAPLFEADQFPAITAAPPVNALASFGDVGAVGEFPAIDAGASASIVR